MLDLKEYQEFCKKDWLPGVTMEVIALGLGGETGEVLEIIKKALRAQKKVDTEHLAEELGDVMWYVANLCSLFNLDLETVIKQNVEKLKERYK